MKRKISNNKGITLIALIITIIILLILAVVSIQIVKQNGLIKRAADAVDFHNTKEKEQNATLDTMTSMIDSFNKKEVEPPTEEEKNALKTLSKDSFKVLAENTGTVLESSSDLRKGDIAVMILPTADDIYIYDFRDEFKCYYYFNSEETIKNLKYETLKKTKTWYVNYTASDDAFEEYKGPGPIQVSDFPDSEIYSKSYLEKIIKSFGTEPDTNKLGKLAVITDEEMSQCKVDQGTPWVAIKNNTDEQTAFGILVVKEGNEFAVEILDGPNNKVYVYTTKETIGNAKFNRWCVGNFDGSNPKCEIYDGPSPIQASDFASSEIYCSSYLNKIIASFNN